ncbi:T9SS type A sorting domain-containing protein [Dyadobacter psychrophilus]|uniref:Por secretion system C-terminal sorting domain-containing protein n=1 Tax=Dyadobacter psychrophilus TaxID=651661 RepID=A0A1T5H972_9BACT|nr:T9SS type A sorting domain-containing protein [Dyadobacter psychrophilus]SKC17253.1 Por secretion system C-terminal sorting domain-containing protein [Dyadobacter psychrophilus]
MKKFILLVFLTFIGSSIFEVNAQQSGIAILDKVPADMQLFARDSTNYADVDFLGRVQVSGYAYFSVVRYRNKTRDSYQRKALQYNGSQAPFNFSFKIKAELAENDFEIYACKSGSDSTLIARRENIVAGDFYLIYGQSNAVAWEVDYAYRNEFARTYGSSGGAAAWGLANAIGQRVGIFGIEFQRVIAERYQIPTCILNGSAAGASLIDLTDKSSFYGHLLNAARETGLLPSLKAIFYWQGETEASSNDPLTWAPRFDKLVQMWKEDYPMVKKIYVFQLPLFGGGPYDDRIGVLREQQRTLDRKYPIIQPYAALGAEGWNGFHYGLEGYLQLGRDLADMAGYNHYGEKEKISSPSLQKAFFSTPEKDEITMVFEDYQQMVYPKDTVAVNIEGSLEPSSVFSMKDYFYLNAEWKKLASGRAEANKIIVKLKEVGNDSTIKYLPSKYHYSGLLNAAWVYIGPFLKNTKGQRAFAFHHNKIFPYTNLGILTLAAAEQDKQVILKWNKLPDATGYILERFEASDTLAAHEILRFPANQLAYTDPSAKKGIPYIYRIRGYTDQSESKLASTTITKQSDDIDVILGEDPTQELSINVYPNPVTDLINIVSARSGINLVELFTMNGKKLKEAGYANKDWATFNVNELSSGQYILRVYYGSKVSTSKVVLVR